MSKIRDIIESLRNVMHKTGDETKEGVLTLSDGLKLQGENVTPFSSGFKNYLINGNFDLWDYATSQNVTGYGSDNNWINTCAGTTILHSQQACGDTERALFNAKYFSRTVVTSVAGASNAAFKVQRVEDASRLAGKTITISFWFKVDFPKNIAVEIQKKYGSGGSPSTLEYATTQIIACTTDWERKQVTFTVPSDIGKTYGTDGFHTSYVQLSFFFDAGSVYDFRTGGLGQQSGTFDISQIQVEEGSVATPFEGIGIELETIRSRRYLRKWVTNGGGFTMGTTTGMGSTTMLSHFPHMNLVGMRVSPTISAIGDTVLSVHGATSGTVPTTFSKSGGTSDSFVIGNGTMTVSLAAGTCAEVRSGTGSITIFASAEL